MPEKQDYSITTQDGWREYMADRDGPNYTDGLAPKSLAKYSSIRDRSVNILGELGISEWIEVTKKSLQQYAKCLDGKYSPRTIHQDLIMLITVINYLIAEGFLPESAKIRWKLKKPKGSTRYCYTRRQVDRMLEYCSADPKLHYLYLLILVLSRTGMRIGEAVNVRMTDIDLRNGFIMVVDERFTTLDKDVKRTVKNSDSRVIPIHSDLMAASKTLDRKRGYLILSIRGEKADPNRLRDQFVKRVINVLKNEFPHAKGEQGFEHGRFHSFRHFFVSEAFVNGVAETDIRDWVGHRDSQVIERYRHLRRSHSKQMINEINFGAADGGESS
jgi:integrase